MRIFILDRNGEVPKFEEIDSITWGVLSKHGMVNNYTVIQKDEEKVMLNPDKLSCVES